jgi:hypothetical protein
MFNYIVNIFTIHSNIFNFNKQSLTDCFFFWSLHAQIKKIKILSPKSFKNISTISLYKSCRFPICQNKKLQREHCKYLDAQISQDGKIDFKIFM